MPTVSPLGVCGRGRAIWVELLLADIVFREEDEGNQYSSLCEARAEQWSSLELAE